MSKADQHVIRNVHSELRLQLSVPGFGAAGDLSYPSFLPSPPPGSVKDQERSWYFYLAEIALRRLANQILTHVAQCAVDDRFDNLEEISAWMPSFESHAQEWFGPLFLHFLQTNPR